MKKKPLKKTSGNRRAISSAESVAKLKQTIAAQAQEIREGAEQQAATSEILRLIAQRAGGSSVGAGCDRPECRAAMCCQ